MKQSQRKRIAVGVAISARFIGSFVGGILMGHVIDEQFSTEPIGLFGGILIGLALGITLLVKSESRLKSDDK